MKTNLTNRLRIPKEDFENFHRFYQFAKRLVGVDLGGLNLSPPALGPAAEIVRAQHRRTITCLEMTCLGFAFLFRCPLLSCSETLCPRPFLQTETMKGDNRLSGIVLSGIDFFTNFCLVWDAMYQTPICRVRQ